MCFKIGSKSNLLFFSFPYHFPTLNAIIKFFPLLKLSTLFPNVVWKHVFTHLHYLDQVTIFS